MIYRLIVNAAFLAVGYYIGREVGRSLASDAPTSNQSKESIEETPAAGGRREGATPPRDA